MGRSGRSWMSANALVRRLEEAERLGKPAYVLHDTVVTGRLILSNRAIDVAVVVTDCIFEEEVDLRYCEFKRAAKFCDCTFVGDFNSGDDTDSRTVYRKNLVCNDSVFWEAAKFIGLMCEGRALFRDAAFLRTEPLEDPGHAKTLEVPQPISQARPSMGDSIARTRTSTEARASAPSKAVRQLSKTLVSYERSHTKTVDTPEGFRSHRSTSRTPRLKRWSATVPCSQER